MGHQSAKGLKLNNPNISKVLSAVFHNVGYESGNDIIVIY